MPGSAPRVDTAYGRECWESPAWLPRSYAWAVAPLGASRGIDEAMTSICGEPPAVSVKLCVRQEKRGGQERGTFFGRRKSITVEVVRVEIGVLGTDLSLRHVNTKSTSKIYEHDCILTA